MRRARPFYEGETIDLIVPTLDHVENSTWYEWFNSQQTSRYTHHGVYPNTIEDQRAFYAGLRDSNRISLLVVNKGGDVPVGTVSISGIDFRRRAGAIAIVMDTQTEERVVPLAALEAIAAMTEHAFDVVGLQRVESGQVYPALARWNQMLEIFGYRTEGIRRNSFVRGQTVSDDVMLACLFTTYARLTESRDGRLWPGAKSALDLIRRLPATPFAQRLDDAHRSIAAEYFGDEHPGGPS